MNSIKLPFIASLNKPKFTDFYSHLEEIFGQFILSACIDDDADILFINIRELIKDITTDNEYYSVLEETPNFIIDKENMNIIAMFNNPIKYNTNAANYIKTIDWSTVAVTPIHIGIETIVFNHKNKWYVADNNGINRYKDIFDELFPNINCLDKNMCHYFSIIHTKLKKVINSGICLNPDGYNNEIMHRKSTDKYCYSDNGFTIPNVEKINKMHFSCLDELVAKIEHISIENKVNKKITTYGYDITNFYTYRLYTDIYMSIIKDIPSFENIHQLYLELYQNNKLTEILPFLSNYPIEIIHRINMTMKTLSRELLNIYHITRKQKNTEIYKILTDTYRKILYGIHGIYIENRKIDFVNGIEKDMGDGKSITVHDIYYYLKTVSFQQLKQLFIDRQKMLTNNIVAPYLIKSCIFTLTQTNLMFS